MGNKDNKIILAPGVSFVSWENDLQAKLARRRVLGHVFHNIEGIKPVSRPTPPTKVENQKSLTEEYQRLVNEYEEKLAEWRYGEIEAQNIILQRLDEKIRPRHYRNCTAKQLFDEVANTHQQSATTPYSVALRALHNTKMVDNAESYCNEFMKNLHDVNNAAELMIETPQNTTLKIENEYVVMKGYAAAMFVEGTMEVKWLSNWRETRAYVDGKKYAKLEDMMSTLRVAVEQRSLRVSPYVASASRISRMEPSPEELCRVCRHKHLNKDCFKQHPELQRYKRNKDKKGKAKVAFQGESSDEGEIDNKNPIVASILNSNKRSLILYDTGASHHFVPNRNYFLNFKKYSKAFKFDQAVGSSSLTHYGTACLSIGQNEFELHDAVYSPKSACTILSAGRLQRLGNIVPDTENTILVQKNKGMPDVKIARLIRKNDVYYISPLNEENSSKEQNQVVAPGVARVPNTISAQRWHERLGHVGQKILKKTMDSSVGLQTINFNNLSTCETCHLSKAQRFISREHRRTPNQPLDEIFVDTIGKLTAAVYGEQYAVIITDAKTRMRWALTTHSKDQIASLLIQWIEDQNHQYNKRVKIIFRDGGSEFLRTKSYCEQHGIRTDVSAPDTPEQNGASEAANKVVLTMARSMLIDARMPPCYWPWAIKHACFIVNRLYCLRTKMVPLIDFLQGLNQQVPEKIDFSNLPRFGCRAYKRIDPKPGKFSPRAETGWFVGFQANTNKNFIIYHPHWTPRLGWKWTESCSPHVTFNEDVMFGDRINIATQQRVSDFWSNDNFTSYDGAEELLVNPPSTFPDIQTEQQIEREHNQEENSPLSETEVDVPRNQNDAQDSLEQLETESTILSEKHIPSQINSQDQRELLLEGQLKSFPLQESEIDPPQQSHKILEEQREHRPVEQFEPLPQRQIEISPQTQIEQDTTQWGHYQQKSQNQSDDVNNNEQIGYDFIMTGWDPLPPIAGQRRSHSPDSSINQRPSKNKIVAPPDSEVVNDEIPYDVIMTGWDPVAPHAGQKRAHSPEAETVRTNRGREVKRHNYYRMHHGMSAITSSDPKTWEEAMTGPEARQWMEAAKEEFSSLKDKGAIKIINRTKLPKGRRPMKCKWVFKKKFLADGTIDKWKARCTAKGFSQRFGIDYQETFAPTPRSETGRIMLNLAHQFNWHRRQGDVPTAFLNPDLDIDLYMEMPQGFERKNHIILLQKGLYGLKQAAALWYDDAKATLGTQGLYPTISDVCLYTTKQKDLFVLLHVDDFQVMGPNLTKIEKLMAALYKKYKLKMVNTDLFLGIKISHPSKNVLKLSQGQYARLLLERHGLTDCKPAKTPLERLMEPSTSGCSSKFQKEYNSIVGGLQYLANNTRPDIAHAVNHLARFLSNPSEIHLEAAKRVLRYISTSCDKGIMFFRRDGKKPNLEAYSDADFAADPSSSRSTSGSLINLGFGPVCWRSHLQREVVLSTTEAEYLAATETCRQLQWVKSLLEELNLLEMIEGSGQTNLYVDNQSTISLIRNHDNHRRSKHIALRNFFCREQHQDGKVKVIYVQSSEQLADSLTKPKSTVPLHHNLKSGYENASK